MHMSPWKVGKESRMHEFINGNDINTLLIRGFVHDIAYCPIINAIVILDKIIIEFNEELQKEETYSVYLAHTLTNEFGEFCFYISDKLSGYKIKVFDNYHES